MNARSNKSPACWSSHYYLTEQEGAETVINCGNKSINTTINHTLLRPPQDATPLHGWQSLVQIVILQELLKTQRHVEDRPFALLLPCNVILYDPSMCINVKYNVTDVYTIGPTG